MSVLRIPLVGSLTDRSVVPTLSSTSKDQRFINCFPQITQNPITSTRGICVAKRDGLGGIVSMQAGATANYGACVWYGNSSSTSPVIVSYTKTGGTTQMFFNAVTAGQIGGDIANLRGCNYITETQISGTANLTATGRDNATSAIELWYFPEGGAWTQVTDADFPSNICSVHCHKNGYAFVITYDTARIYNSDLNNLSSWSATSYITADSVTDGAVGITTYGDLIVAFGKKSIEFFVIAGNATGSVLKKTGEVLDVGADFNFNTGSPILNAGGTVYWLGVDSSGTRGVYRLKGATAEKISTDYVDRQLIGGYFMAGAFSCLGQTHIAISNGTAGQPALCYCLDTGVWWYFLPAGALSFTAIVGGPTAYGNSSTVFTTATNANTYQLNQDVWQDNSSAYTMTVQTENLDLDSSLRKFWRRIALTYDIQSSTSNIGVSWSDDDYATFSSARNIDSSAAQNWSSGLGSSRRRAWKITHAANTACRIYTADITYDIAVSGS